jgi:ribosome biogenesis GTPase A
MAIQWFPGHMAKARRQITEKLKLIDVVFELVDARIPLSSRNPMIDEIIAEKPRILLLNKADMADPKVTEEWRRFFKQYQTEVLQVNSHNGNGVEKIAPAAHRLLHEKRERMKAKGMNPRAVRALILGIPNVGKSTLINRLAGRKTADIGDRPGITKSQQWIKIKGQLELLDTPGILWPKFEDEATGLKLAATGAIKDDLVDFQDTAYFTLKFLKERYPDSLRDRYRLEIIPDEIIALFDEIGKKRGCFISGGEVDYEKTSELVLREFRSGKLGRLSMEHPSFIEL